MIDNCHICISNKDLEANLLSTEYWYVILSPDQGYLGRAYVTLRDHKEALSELSEAEWQDYASIVKRLENAYKVGLRTTLSNWTCLMNNVYQKKPSFPHVHWHFRPRYEEAVTLNGITFKDPDFGFHYDRDQKQSVDDATFQIIIERVKATL